MRVKPGFPDQAKRGKGICPLDKLAQCLSRSRPSCYILGNESGSPVRPTPLRVQRQCAKCQGVWGTASTRASHRRELAESASERCDRHLGRVLQANLVSRFPSIDPVGNGNGKRSFFASSVKVERPPVSVRQFLSHRDVLARIRRFTRNELFEGNAFVRTRGSGIGISTRHTARHKDCERNSPFPRISR